MMKLRKSAFICIFPLLLAVSACQTNSKDQLLLSDKGQVELRAIQTRAFDTGDKNQTLRTVMATLQDLGFVLDKADAVLGTVSATKLDGYQLRMTVTVRSRDENKMLVRASAQYGNRSVSEAAPYQNFFTSLEKAMFLAANQVD